MDARGIVSTENRKAKVQDSLEYIDGALRLTKIRAQYYAKLRRRRKDQSEWALAAYVDKCLAYQSTNGCINKTSDAVPEAD